jgi:hypothetical protein
MTDEKKIPEWSNADDPTADRLASYSEAGELNPSQDGAQRVGSEKGPATTPRPQPGGPHGEIVFERAAGGIGGSMDPRDDSVRAASLDAHDPGADDPKDADPADPVMDPAGESTVERLDR